MSKINRPRLGRGLHALLSLPAVEEETEQPTATPRLQDLQIPAGSAVVELPVEQIKPNPSQPRRDFRDESLSELADSLRINGIIQPIVVRQAENGFELIAGERRLRAAKLAGLATVPAIIKEVDELTQAQLALVENIQREDLNPIDRAQAYRMLMDQLKLTQADLATRLGQDRSSVAHYLRLLDLNPEVQELVRQGTLSMGHAKLLAGVADKAEQLRLARMVAQQGTSVRQLESLLKEQKPQDDGEVPAPTSSATYLANLEKSFSRQLGMRVQIRAGAQKGKGRLIIHYGNLDQFDDIKDRLGLEVD